MLVPRSITAIAVVTDPGSSRYALGGILLERDAEGKPHAVASDGRQLIEVTWNEPKDDRVPVNPKEGFTTILEPSALVAADRASKLSPAAAKMEKWRHLRYLNLDEHSANGLVTISTFNTETSATQQVRSVDGRFPKWRDCFPRREENKVCKIRLDAKLLAGICETYVKLCRTDANKGIDLVIPLDGEGAVTFSATNNEAGITVNAVLMPLARDR